MNKLFKQLETLGLNLTKTIGVSSTVIDFVCDFYSGDREIYVRVGMRKAEIVGLNFMQGIYEPEIAISLDHGRIDPCIHLTAIYDNLKHNHMEISDRIEKAIELYCIAHHDYTCFLDGTFENGYQVFNEEED
tara:strand:- start:612 stop:1007 length:396 start_codon:yes stop_codon:yes gene_type:complete